MKTEVEPIAGGLGGGGHGGVGTKVAPGNGEDGKGGGGGGGRAASSGKAGSGGCGVVYVRISMAFEDVIPKPEPVQNYIYDGNAHTSVVESLAYEIDGPVVGTDVGDYEAKVMLMEGLSWRGGGEREQKVVMHITKAEAKFTSLVQKDWMFGTPDAAVPKPKYTVSLPGVLALLPEYADSEGGPYQSQVPTEIGTHWVRLRIADTVNYTGDTKATSFRIVNGLGNTFTDYVEITIEGYPGPGELTNFPYKVVLSEKKPNGFLYSRVGSPDQMAFTDADNKVIDYEVGKWNVEEE